MTLLWLNFLAIGITGIVGIWSVAVSYRFARTKNLSRREWLNNWIGDFSVGMIQTFLTALLFTLMIGYFQERETNKIDRDNLIQKLRVPIPEISVGAFYEIVNRGWLCDGSLADANLYGINISLVDSPHFLELICVNLQGAHLFNANMAHLFLNRPKFRDADLVSVNLSAAKIDWGDFKNVLFGGANLSESIFNYANMVNAKLSKANLSKAQIFRSNLRSADLSGAILRGASFIDTDLSNVVFTDAEFDETTILPDNTHWTPQLNLSRFTDPSAPDFWRSTTRRSPAYTNYNCEYKFLCE